jgi:UDPglucose--hexose-1-phosphate uridylyltransferase
LFQRYIFGSVKKHATRLADGRELIYYAERDDAAWNAVDTRELPPRSPGAQLRYDPLTDEWVAIAAHRQSRTFLPPADDCPLCPSTARHATEIPSGDYDIVVLENRFPSFADAPRTGAKLPAGVPDHRDGAAAPWDRTRPGGGRCEVVVYSSDHNASVRHLSPQRVRALVAVLADRTETLRTIPGVEQVFCFENRGVEIGVTLHHPHGQIYAYPFLPPHSAAVLESARRYAKSRGGNLFADLLAAERAAGDRIVAENEHWTAFVPRAARWPFEMYLAPRQVVPDLPALDDEAVDAFGPLYLDVLRRLDGVFNVPMPYVAAWHQAPARAGRDVSHLYLQLFSTRRGPDKLKYLAGSESAMGTFVNDIAPEFAAALLRAA